MFELKAKNALVTGAARRIGHAISVGLAKQGTNVIVHYSKSSGEAEKLCRELIRLGVKSWLVSADFAEAESCEKLFMQALEKAGKIDVLINNASVFSVGNFDDVELEDVNSGMLINAWTPFLLSRLFARNITEGKIVNMLDTRIMGHDLNHFPYYVSKKMLETLTRSLAVKLAPGITVNAVAPGLILPPEGRDYGYLEKRKTAVPLKKYGSVSDVVEAVLFLLRSDFVTGQIVYVDGGMHLVQTLEGVS